MQKVRRGPPSLGRSVLINPGDTTPDEWLGVKRLGVDELKLDFLRESWMKRRPLVIEMPSECIGFYNTSQKSKRRFDAENLFFYITENSINALNPDNPRWWATEIAIEMGASSVPTGHQNGDLITPDGKAIWVDGGPFTLNSLRPQNGIHIVPRVHLKQNKLVPIIINPQVQTVLDPEQLAAVTSDGGPSRIIAPAGSGKTRVLTERIKFLTASGVDTKCITAIAYNIRARSEMQDRLGDMTGVQIKTFHALAYQIIGDYRDDGTRPIVLNEIGVRDILEGIIPSTKRRANVDQLEPWVDAISYCRETLISPDAIPEIFPELADGNFEDVFIRYREILKSRDVVDFSEMITLACEFLSSDGDFCERIRERLGILLIDEFQDLTPSLARLTKLISGPSSDVFCVGDDDQTIYSFTGASPKYLVQFDELFPTANHFSLETNYRCPPSVIEAAKNLLSHNSYRVQKTINPSDDNSSVPEEIRKEDLFDISHNIRKQIDNGAGISDICVLARTNAALIIPYFLLNLDGIPTARPPGLSMQVLNRTGIASVLAWLDIGNRNINQKSLNWAMSRPRRDISPKIRSVLIKKRSLDEIDNFMSNNTNQKMVKSMSDFVNDAKKIQKLIVNGSTTSEIMDVILESFGVGALIYRLDDSQRTSRKNSHRDELEAFKELATLEPDPRKFVPFIEGTLSQDQDSSEHGISLDTVHRAKGLEWKHVHIFNVSETQFPHSLSESIEEERRLFHVGITRCINTLDLYYREKNKSPFIDELTKRREERPREFSEPDRNPSSHPPLTARERRQERLDGILERREERRRELSKPDVEPDENDLIEQGIHDESLLIHLKSWRLERAKTDKVPAYVVAKDETLKEIAQVKPMKTSDLIRINGIGQIKIEKYGDEIIGIIKNYQSNETPSGSYDDNLRQPETTPSPKRLIRESSTPEYPHLPRHLEEKLERLHDNFPDVMENYPRAYVAWTPEEESILGDLFESGLSISQISDKLERNPGGIRSRLSKLGID